MRRAALIAALLAAEPLGGQTVQYRSREGVEYRSQRDTGAIARAQVAHAADPRNVQRLVQLGRAQADARQFREAIETFTRGLGIAPRDPTLHRWRGHSYIRVHEPMRALGEFYRVSGPAADTYGFLYDRGFLNYVREEFGRSADDFTLALARATDAAERVAATDWLWRSLSRAGRHAEAKAMLERQRDSLPATNAHARLLWLYRGQIGPDVVMSAADTSDVAIASLSYGVGNWYLLRGDTTRARAWFERSVRSGGWPAYGFVMTEIEFLLFDYAAARPSADSIRAIQARLGRMLVPLEQAIDSMAGAMRADSGTVRADSAYWSFRASFGALVGAASRAFDSPALQILVYPGGAGAQQRDRRLGLIRDKVYSADVAIADSLINFLRQRGIWTQRAEGDAYFSVNETALLRAFDPFLTVAGLEAGRLVALEQTTPTAADASIQVSWDALSERVAATDRFLQKNAGAPGADLFRDWQRRYLALYLGGSDNSEVFNRQTMVYNPEVRQSLERYVLRNGQLPSGKAVAEYLALLKANNYTKTPAVEAFLRKLWAH